MIAVVCAECGETFEIGDEFAGNSEFCPACGTLNDIPDPTAPQPDVPTLEIAEIEKHHPAEIDVLSLPAPPSSSGIPTALWWTILIGGIGLFLLICIYLFSDNWESRNIQLLSDATSRGDALMADEDFAGAARQYQFVLNTVGHRTIDSSFIQHLIAHARDGEIDANNRLKNPRPQSSQIQSPQTQPAASTQPANAFVMALHEFQVDYELFPSFVRQHPVVFRDEKGNWRRRQYFIWQVAYDEPAPSDSPKILLRYSCASNITTAHANRYEAEHDDSFVNEESPKEVQCQTQFQWLANHWVIVHHDADVEKDVAISVNTRPSLDEFYVLERQAFHAMQAAP